VFFSVDVEAAVQLAVAATLNTQRAASGSEGLWENTRQSFCRWQLEKKYSHKTIYIKYS